MTTKFCHGCGKELHQSARSCPHCGAEQTSKSTGVTISAQGKTVMALVCWFFGIIGAHRFITGKIGTGIIQLVLTCTIVGMIISGIWALIDFFQIVTGNFTDKDGNLITNW